MCLLTLKYLLSLQSRTRPSVQTELDLHTTVFVLFVALDTSGGDTFESFFFFGFTEMVCTWLSVMSGLSDN